MSGFDYIIAGILLGVILTFIILTFIGYPEYHFEAGARAVCDSHGLELDSYDYITSSEGFEFVKCKPSEPVPVFGVFENIGGDGK